MINIYTIAFSFLVKIVLFKSLSENVMRNNFDSEINFIIKTKENQDLLYYDLDINPSEVLVNGKRKNNCLKKCDLAEGEDNITLIFKFTIESCFYWFYGLNIIEIDFSKFDFSTVKDMSYMLSNAHNLEKINFGNIDTSSLRKIDRIFDGCSKLTSVDLSKFDFSYIRDMSSIFSYCNNLVEINFGKINTSSVEKMRYSFYSCKKLKSIELSNFNTVKVKDMTGMFGGCLSLLYLNLSNFNHSNLNAIDEMFVDCESLIYLTLGFFQLNNAIEKNDVFKGVPKSVKICANNIDTINYLIENNLTSDCSNYCFKEGKDKKIDLINKDCANSCENVGYEYNNICYNKCPKGKLVNNYFCEDNLCNNEIQNSIKCLDKTPQGYYLDLEDEIYKKCYKNCKFCLGPGNELNNNCTECESNYIFLNGTLKKNNCYQICNYYYYFDEANIYHCTDSYQCPKKYNKLILEQKKCVEDNLNEDISYINYNSWTYEYPTGKIIDEKNIICEKVEYPKDPDELLNHLKNNLISGLYINNIDKGNDFIYSVENIIFEITSTKNQKNKESNLSTINFKECETKLKELYNISHNDSLYILKIDALVENILKIEYGIFYPFSTNNLTKLNLSICKDIRIDISIPFYIPLNEVDKYNMSSGFYNDICYKINSENGVDKTIKERQNEFIKNNLSICEEDCNFNDYDNITKKAVCSCFTKIKLPMISEIKVNKEILFSNFKDIRNIGNFNMLKCINLLFEKIIFLKILQIICLLYFLF